MTEKRRAYFDVTPQLIEEALHLPVGVKVIGAEWTMGYGAIRLHVEGPDFPLVMEGSLSTRLTPQLSSDKNPVTGAREHHWSWGL